MDQLKSNMELFYEATRIPICCFQGKDLVTRYSHQLQDYSLPLLLFDALPKELPDVWYSFTPEYIYFGGLRLPETGHILFVGPTLQLACTRKQAQDLCRRIGRRTSDIPAIQNYFSQTGPHTAPSLLANLKLLCRICGSPMPDTIPLLPFSWKLPYSVDLEPRIPRDEDETDDLEKEMTSCIASGNLPALNKLISERVMDSNASLALDTARSYILGSNMIASRTAISAGVNYGVGNALSGHYIDQILQARSTAELSNLFFQLMQDYTSQVAKLHTLRSDSPIVNYVQQYTTTHCDQKITPHLLAERLNMSCSYLCTHFKQETGMTISSYVQQEKIREAKRLLRGSSYTIVEISEALAFSSESYFCTVFKKIAGMTPASYRQSRQSDWKLPPHP